ncbi:hypothetical protein MBCUT_17570 [Methanobrevibacter cuticularis]|uniref:Uncharacterized protein n=1 Tax=Methanobrevibacter cuticularis TaxID=47311 RepID=A0A166CKH0_9EURY|nr:hypothetical protein [Methanobrevibacter cuticularis]KZX15047.1 hypothetical protein MBCUT_17570 [Methanobrevibacter cuticularis]
MVKNVNQHLRNNLRNDLRKRNNVSDIFFFNRLSIQSCMVILCVFTVLLLSVLSVASTPNPSILFGI